LTSLTHLQELEQRYALPTYVRNPVQFVRGSGAVLWDEHGDEYLDFLAGISVLNVGHCHPLVVSAIQEQAARLTHTSNLYYTEPVMRLSRALSESSLGGRVFFANSGAEANEAAIKLARRAKPGGEIVVLRDAFHGRTYAALSATPQEAKQAPFAPLVPGFRVVDKDPDALRAAVGPHTAAVLLEPIQGESGVLPLGDALLVAAREACDSNDAALIFDEVQTGMGRTGTLWAYEQTPVVPDVITTAKALGGGLPIGAIVTGPRFADAFQPGDHGSTFGGGLVVCAAAFATLGICSDPELLASVIELGERLAGSLAELPFVSSVRGRGLLIGAELVSGVDAIDLARRALLEERVVINATGPSSLRFEPPLIVTAAQIDEVISRLARLAS
jgi:acetylornithine/N-succinyldiaminopimelate aminotransferase